jgi:hypothetical protein
VFKDSGSWLPSLLPVLPSSDSPIWPKSVMQQNDHLWHFPKSLLPNLSVHMTVKQFNVTLCIKCYTTWKKINMNHPFWIPKHIFHNPTSWQVLSWIFREVELPCDTSPCWITLEAAGSYNTLVSIYQIILYQIPKDHNLNISYSVCYALYLQLLIRYSKYGVHDLYYLNFSETLSYTRLLCHLNYVHTSIIQNFNQFFHSPRQLRLFYFKTVHDYYTLQFRNHSHSSIQWRAIYAVDKLLLNK